MIPRLLTTWFPVASAIVVALSTFGLSRFAAYPHQAFTGDKPLPPISQVFFPPSFWPYLFPIPLALWAIVVTFRVRQNDQQPQLLSTVSFSITISFIAVFLFALILPFFPMIIEPIRQTSTSFVFPIESTVNISHSGL
jgi:hypothetical protein